MSIWYIQIFYRQHSSAPTTVVPMKKKEKLRHIESAYGALSALWPWDLQGDGRINYCWDWPKENRSRLTSMLHRMASGLVILLQCPRDSHLNHKDAAVTPLIWTRGHMQQQQSWTFFFFLTLSWDADQQASTSLLSAGRHQRRRIMCNYNRQSKTKPFTFNELHLEGKGRLPQGGILMKQMAECSQGPTLPVLLFAVCQHFQHSKEFHLSLHRSLCVECVGEPFCPSTRYRGSDQAAALSWPIASRSVPFALRHLQLCEAQLSIWAKRTNTADRCPVCLILYFISSSTCAYWQCRFFLPSSIHHTRHKPRLMWVCLWLSSGSVYRPVGTHSAIPVQFPYCFSPTPPPSAFPVFNAEKK